MHPTVTPTDIGPIQRPFTIAPTLSKGGTLAEYALNAYRETTLIICKFPPKWRHVTSNPPIRGKIANKPVFYSDVF